MYRLTNYYNSGNRQTFTVGTVEIAREHALKAVQNPLVDVVEIEVGVDPDDTGFGFIEWDHVASWKRF